MNPGLFIEQNMATRFGGGVYVGIYDNGGTQGWCSRFDQAFVDLSMATVRLNSAGMSISDLGYLASPSQIVTENVLNGGLPCRPLTPAAGLGFTLTTLQGSAPATDLGLYQTNSISFIGSPYCVPTTLYKCVLIQ